MIKISPSVLASDYSRLGEESILIAARQFSASNEIYKLIECTSNLDFTTTKNEIIRLFLGGIE